MQVADGVSTCAVWKPDLQEKIYVFRKTTEIATEW